MSDPNPQAVSPAAELRRDIPALTGLRGIAALYVVTYHIFPPWRLGSDWLGALVGRGYLAVDVFFVLSGFVMAMSYGATFAGRLRPRDGAMFLLKRVARIFPLYLAVLAGRFVWSLTAYGSVHVPRNDAAVAVSHATPVHDVLANATLTQSWGMAHSIIGQSWSVSVEWAAYFLFPLLAAGALFRGRHMAGALAVAGVICVLLTAGLDLGDGAYHSGALDAWDGRGAGPLLRCAGGFILGLLTFRAWRRETVRRIAGHDLAGIAVVGWCLLASLAGLPDLAVYPAFPLLVLCLASNESRFAGAFEWRPVVGLGVLSYAIYLMHGFVQQPLQALQDRMAGEMPALTALVLCFALMMLVLPAIAWPAYVGVERPGRRWVREAPALLWRVVMRRRQATVTG